MNPHVKRIFYTITIAAAIFVFIIYTPGRLSTVTSTVHNSLKNVLPPLQLEVLPAVNTTIDNYFHHDDAADNVSQTPSDTRDPSINRHLQFKPGFKPLPSSVMDGIKTYVFFIGVGRSGHSIVAALLDSHPHIVISNELDVFNRVINSSRQVSRSYIFNQIWNAAYRRAKTMLQNTNKGYSLAIDGLYQGKYKSYIDVIGDKHGGSTAKTFLHNSAQFKDLLNKLRTVVNIPIKAFHVIRNPYDNIATRVMYAYFGKRRDELLEFKSSNETLTFQISKMLSGAIKSYFNLYQISEVMRQEFNLNVMDIHSKDLIADPKATVGKMCAFLQVHCSDDYLNIVSEKIFSGESKTRYKLAWTNEQISKVKEGIMKYSSLTRYFHFDS